MKIRLLTKGERRSDRKDLERQPLTVWIQGRQPYEDIRFWANDAFPYLKDPRSKALEPDCLSSRTFHCETVSNEEEHPHGIDLYLGK